MIEIVKAIVMIVSIAVCTMALLSVRRIRREVMARAEATLADLLTRIEDADAAVNYPTRYALVIRAVGAALRLDIPAGFAYDPMVDPGYPIVAYIELPTGQVSWHMPEHPPAWDGHTNETKYQRCRDYALGVANAAAS